MCSDEGRDDDGGDGGDVDDGGKVMQRIFCCRHDQLRPPPEHKSQN